MALTSSLKTGSAVPNNPAVTSATQERSSSQGHAGILTTANTTEISSSTVVNVLRIATSSGNPPVEPGLSILGQGQSTESPSLVDVIRPTKISEEVSRSTKSPSESTVLSSRRIPFFSTVQPISSFVLEPSSSLSSTMDSIGKTSDQQASSSSVLETSAIKYVVGASVLRTDLSLTNLGRHLKLKIIACS